MLGSRTMKIKHSFLDSENSQPSRGNTQGTWASVIRVLKVGIRSKDREGGRWGGEGEGSSVLDQSGFEREAKGLGCVLPQNLS